MPTRFVHRVSPGQRISLAEVSADPPADYDEDRLEDEFDRLNDELDDLQELLYGAGKHALLLVLQGLDTGGKDGLIKHLLSVMNPQGARIESFKVPTAIELAHDYLWRIHKVTPERGMIGIFNRSHYEDVLVVRVHNYVPEEVWQKRYEQINQFEEILSENNTIILKFFLYISKDEQARRLMDREQELKKAWKLSAGDWAERQHWDKYIAAYEDALAKCSTEHAPWYIVPANDKDFRNLAVTEALVDALTPYKEKWEQALVKIREEELASLAQVPERNEIKARYDAEKSAAASSGSSGKGAEDAAKSKRRERRKNK